MTKEKECNWLSKAIIYLVRFVPEAICSIFGHRYGKVSSYYFWDHVEVGQYCERCFKFKKQG